MATGLRLTEAISEPTVWPVATSPSRVAWSPVTCPKTVSSSSDTRSRSTGDDDPPDPPPSPPRRPPSRPPRRSPPAAPPPPIAGTPSASVSWPAVAVMVMVVVVIEVVIVSSSAVGERSLPSSWRRRRCLPSGAEGAASAHERPRRATREGAKSMVGWVGG